MNIPQCKQMEEKNYYEKIVEIREWVERIELNLLTQITKLEAENKNLKARLDTEETRYEVAYNEYWRALGKIEAYEMCVKAITKAT